MLAMLRSSPQGRRSMTSRHAHASPFLCSWTLHRTPPFHTNAPKNRHLHPRPIHTSKPQRLHSLFFEQDIGCFYTYLHTGIKYTPLYLQQSDNCKKLSTSPCLLSGQTHNQNSHACFIFHFATCAIDATADLGRMACDVCMHLLSSSASCLPVGRSTNS